MPKISIIVPNYNTEKFLPRCLDSLTGQTLKDIEIILIDDGSKDNSVAIMKEYAQKDPRIKVIEQQNSGPARARNQGLENATGKYLMFCDSDDWYEPDMCQVMYDTIENKKTDIVCCYTLLHCEDGLSASDKEKRLVEGAYNLPRSGIYPLSEEIVFSTNVLLWNKIWRRDIVQKWDIKFPAGHEHDDDAFWYMYAFMAKDIFFLQKHLYHYFIRGGSIMATQVNKTPKNRMDRWAITEYVLNFFQGKPLSQPAEVIMPRIYLTQLRCGSPFFTLSEQKDLCDKAHEILQSRFVEKVPFLYIADGVYYLVKNKSFCKLIYEWIWYRLAWCFWTLSKKEDWRQHSNKYARRISKNNFYWRYLVWKK